MRSFIPLLSRSWLGRLLIATLVTLGNAVICEAGAELEKTASAKAKTEEAKPSKCQYNLFNPTPRELMREMSTDRPDRTESPYTVDAGHFQIEMDLANYTYTRVGSLRLNQWNVAPVNFKMGLLNNVDLQIVYDGYVNQSIRVKDEELEIDEKEHTSGGGDLTARVKFNVWGNDGGTTALAIMPYVKIPTNTAQLGNRFVEGGIIVPLAIELPYGFGMGIMSEVDFLKDYESSGYSVGFTHSVTFSRNIIGNLGGYVEFATFVSTEKQTEWIGTFDTGLTYGLTDDIQLDCGCNFGVTRFADDYNPFVGVSVRF
ncbi:MAG: transporter [Candidatus Methylacidiphilales bacterium]|nr:transporter [Candidatus Methylacidiphilales bacterium]